MAAPAVATRLSTLMNFLLTKFTVFERKGFAPSLHGNPAGNG